MAWYFPVICKNKSEKRQNIPLPNKFLTDEDIISFVEDNFKVIRLMSDDIIYISVLAQEAKRKENLNDIVSAITGYAVYGPVFMVSPKELK